MEGCKPVSTPLEFGCRLDSSSVPTTAEGKVMRLLKCLYGLKESSRQWNILIDTVLKKLGFKRLLSDVGMYVKGEGVDAVYIALYVDDLFIVGMKLINIESVKKGLYAEFKMKDLGED